MIKYIKLRKLRKEITDICSRHGYQLLGNIHNCKIDDENWTFAVKTPSKHFLVKLIVPFGCCNMGLCFNSSDHVSASATVFAMHGMFGSINIPISRDYHFKLPESAFDIPSDKLEKIYLIFPKCTQFYIREPDKNHLSSFRVGMKLNGISIHDGASFKYLLQHPDEERKFAEYGE